MDFQPLVSIIIPVYNGSNFLQYAIDSALGQTYKKIEIIVVNDGSDDSDSTEQIARSYGDKIRYFHKENGGVASALNFGISRMKGEYFSWLSHDDMYTKTKIEDQIQTLQKMQDKTLILAAGYKVVNEDGKELYDVDHFNKFGREILERPLCALFRMALNGCALLIHKSHFIRAGMFDEHLPTTQDYECFYRLMRGQKIVYEPYINVLTRSHGEQGSKKHIDSHIKECNALWIRLVDNLSKEDFDLMGETENEFYDWIRKYFKEHTLYREATIYFDSLYLSSFKRIPDNQFFVNQFHISPHLVGENKLFDLAKDSGKTKVAFMIGTVNELGGLSRVIIQIASGLCAYYDVTLIVYEPPTGDGYAFSPQVHLLALEYKNFGLDTVRLLKYLGVSCVIISHNCMESYLSLYQVLKKYRIKTIAWSHEHYFIPYYKRELRDCVLMRKNAFQSADVVFWLNRYSNDIYNLYANNSLVMPNPNPNLKQPEYCNEFSHNIIAVGRFDDERKGLKELLQVFSLVREKCRDAELFIIGSYDLEMITLWEKEFISFRVLLQRLGLTEKNVHFLGMIKDVESYYRKGCVHVLPSRYEGFGLVILEAFSFGIPNIVFENSGMDDLVINDYNGFLVPKRDVVHMANCVLKILKNERLYYRLRENAKKTVSKYDEEHILRKWKSVIDALTVDGNNKIKYSPSRLWSMDEYRELIEEYDYLFTLPEKNDFENNFVQYIFQDDSKEPFRKKLIFNSIYRAKKLLNSLGILTFMQKTSLYQFLKRSTYKFLKFE